MNTPSLLKSMPDDARVWVYAATRDLGSAETDALLRDLGPFLGRWTSHQKVVRGEATMVHGRFLVLAAHADDGDLSGCGIDKSVHEIEAVAETHGIRWCDPLSVAWRAPDGSVAVAPRGEFRQAVRDGGVTASTAVFDLSVTELGAVRSGAFERPAGTSWHARVFRIPEETASTD